MADITIRDLCRWDRRLTLVPPAGVAPEVVLDRAISWAVSVRATPPLLPPLRGDELVVLPMRVLEQIESGETLSREALMETLTRQRIAAILTEPAFTEEPIEAIPVLVLPSPFPHDVEGGINRIITERRAELYRLGNELSRRLSEAVLDPRGLEALLRTASELSGRSLILQDADGNVVAASQIDDIPPASVEALLSARRAVGPVLVPEPGGTERLITTLSTGGQAGYLSTAGAAGTLTESDRLVLTQTAGTCSIVLSQQNRAGPSARSGPERLVADLLLGRLASDAATMARGQMLGIDPAAPVTVGLIETPDGPATARDLVIQALGKAAGDNVATIHDALGFILPHDGGEQASQAFRRVLWDDALAGADSLTYAAAVAAAIRKLGDVDLVIFGREFADTATDQHIYQVARKLGWTMLGSVARIEAVDFDAKTIRVARMTEHGTQTLSSALPAVISVLKDINEPKYPTFIGIRKAAKAEMPVWGVGDLGLDAAALQPRAQQVRYQALPAREGTVEIIEGASAQEKAARLVDKLLEEKVL